MRIRLTTGEAAEDRWRERGLDSRTRARVFERAEAYTITGRSASIMAMERFLTFAFLVRARYRARLASRVVRAADYLDEARE